MDPLDLPQLSTLVSQPRFDTYLSHCQGRADLASRTYLWNVELTAAFWGPVSIVEIVVRNAVHDAMRVDRPDDWWNLPSVRLLRRERLMVERAVSDLVRKGVIEPSAGQVVASHNGTQKAIASRARRYPALSQSARTP